MADWSSFWIGVASSIVATLIVAIAVGVKTRIYLNWNTFVLFWTITRRLRETGVSNVFTQRSDYYNFRKERTVAEYMDTVVHNLIYVGFWLAHTSEIEDISRSLRKLVADKGHTVELVLLDENLDEIAAQRLAKYLGLDVESMRNRIRSTWRSVQALKASLPPECRERLILKKHQEHIASSAFVFDYQTPTAKTLIDLKLYGAGRDQSFGIELRKTRTPNSLYDRITESFLAIRRTSTPIE